MIDTLRSIMGNRYCITESCASLYAKGAMSSASISTAAPWQIKLTATMMRDRLSFLSRVPRIPINGRSNDFYSHSFFQGRMRRIGGAGLYYAL